MKAIEAAFPFRQTFRHWELDKRWWHRLLLISFFALLVGTAAFIAADSYLTFAPQLSTMPVIRRCDIFDEVAAGQESQDGGCLDLSAGLVPKASAYPAQTDAHPMQAPPVATSTNPSAEDSASTKPLKKTIEMPDGSTSFFAHNVSDDEIKSKWHRAETRQTLKAVLFAAFITIAGVLVIGYSLQFAYRAVLYVIFGSIATE